MLYRNTLIYQPLKVYTKKSNKNMEIDIFLKILLIYLKEKKTYPFEIMKIFLERLPGLRMRRLMCNVWIVLIPKQIIY